MTNDITPRESIHGKQRRTSNRNKTLSLLAVGTPIAAISGQLKMSKKTIYKLLKDPEFYSELEKERELISVDAISATATIVADAVAKVAMAIEEGDARLAFDFLRETGVLRTTGGKIGMEKRSVNEKNAGGGLNVVINVDSSQFKTDDVIDVETVDIDNE